MDLINKIKNVLINPFKFFENLKKEKGIRDAFIYLVILSLFAAVFGTVVGYFFQEFSLGMVSKVLGLTLPKPEYSFGYLFFWALIGYAIGLVMSFVWAGLLHAWILIFGGKGNYTKTYQLSVYYRTPRFVFGWIPVVSSLVWIYNLILLIIGTEKVHDISRLRAILMYLIPVGVLILFVILILVFMVVVFASYPGILKDALVAP